MLQWFYYWLASVSSCGEGEDGSLSALWCGSALPSISIMGEYSLARDYLYELPSLAQQDMQLCPFLSI